MSIRHTQARHRAAPIRSNPFEAVSKAVSSHAGSVGRTTAVVAATSGLVLGLAAPGQAAAPVIPSSDTAPVSSVSVPTSNTYNSTTASVTSTPAPRTTTHRTASPRATSGSTGTQTRTSPRSNTTPAATTTSGAGFQSTARGTTPRTDSTPNQGPTAKTTSTAVSSKKTSGIAGTALSFEGVGYTYGGETPGAWDCSGFVKYVYGQAGVDLPHNTTAILASGKFVETSNPSPGDLVYQNGGSHVGIYIGGGKIIGAQNPTSGTVIREADSVYGPLMGYYTLAS